MQLECPSRFRWLEKQSVRETFAEDVAAGLLAHPRRLPCRYFYDARGSKLFEEICQLPEYYLTRTEHLILQQCADLIVDGAPAGLHIVELGSGSASKTRLLFDAYLRRHPRLCYVPVDISPSILETSSHQLLEDFPGLQILAIAAEYEPGLAALRQLPPGPKTLLWLGSNVGNLERAEAARFLARASQVLSPPDRLLMGVDLRKDPEILRAAYDDQEGVTARFNLNILRRINRELGADFQVDQFCHRVHYDEEAGRIEMYLESLVQQTTHIPKLGLQIDWRPGQRVHTENSHKYSRAELDQLVTRAGLRYTGFWTDGQEHFALTMLARALGI